MTVSHLSLTGVLRVEEPLHIGSGRRTGVIKHCLPYVPGSTLRGCAGTALLRLTCRLGQPLIDHSSCEYAEECAYARLFESEESASSLFFRYAYPLHLRCGGVFRPAPKTLYRCENSQCGEVSDSLEPPDRCKCGGRVKPYIGYKCDRCGELSSQPIQLTWFTSTALDRGVGAAASIAAGGQSAGTLHTIEAIQTGSRFFFEVILGSKLSGEVEALRSVLEKGLPDEGLGGSKSRGFGKVSLSDIRVEEVSVEDMEARAEEIDSACFSVQALSPLILERPLDDRSLLEGARRAYSWVYHEGKPQLPDLVHVASRLALTRVGGWSQKEGRSRGVLQAVEVGSITQFKCGESSEVLSRALATLEVYPLGEYKPHGCGQLRVQSPR